MDRKMSDEEVKEHAEKIRSLVLEDEKEFAIELVRGLNDPRLYGELSNLSELNLNFCTSLAERQVEEVRQALPNCVITF